VYAFCRMADDSVDEAPDAETKIRGITRWRRSLENAYQGRATHPVMIQLMDTIKDYDIPKEYFQQLLDGVEMDITHNRYETFAALNTYCYKVASVVGLICIRIFGYRDIRIPAYAENLGMALQLTNILRDIGRDAKMGRIYLPLEDLRHFGVTEGQILEGKVTDGFRSLIDMQWNRAEAYYRRAEESWDPAEIHTMYPALIMKTVYHQLLEKIRSVRYDVFHNEISLSKLAKLRIAFGIYLKAKF
jgi:15-cis-phytoene synthase